MPWKPRDPADVPTLGWAVLAWAAEVLPSPLDDGQTWTYTDEQARLILRWFELDPDTGEFVYLRGVVEEAKGWGKSPFAATLALAELCGPVCFDGWDAAGQPVGVPWGTGERPPPLVQIAAVSEDQTENTYGAAYSMLTANEHRAAITLGIDDGRTRLYLRNRPGKLEPVTASAGSREGQRVTFAILDETHLWTPRNGGVRLARTIRRNAAKMRGRTLETTNAPVLGERSVAEQSDPMKPEPGVLHYARRPKVQPQSDWPQAKLRSALAEAYGDAYWIDPDRLLREIADPANTWDDALRFWFNVRSSGFGRAVDPRAWDKLGRATEVPAKTYIALGFDGSLSRDATMLRGCTPDGYSFLIGKWVKPKGVGTWQVPHTEVNAKVAWAFDYYHVGLMLADPPFWWTDIERWAEQYGEEVVLKFDTNQPRRMAPAVGRWLAAIREGEHTHDNDETTSEHVKAAHLRRVRLTADEDDGRTLHVLVKGDSSDLIDGALADVLAFEAAMTLPVEIPESNYESRGFRSLSEILTPAR